MFAITDDFILDMFVFFNLVEDDSKWFDDQATNAGSFTFVNQIGSIEPYGDGYANLNFEKVESEYRLRAQLTPSIIGVHTILFVPREAQIRGNSLHIQQIDKDGKDVVLANGSTYINMGDTNFDLLRDNQKGVSNFDDDKYLENDVYTFYVRE